MSHPGAGAGAGDTSTTNTNVQLPPVAAFAFRSILQAVEPDIQSALDSIAEIYARSKLSLADEYSAHRPPLGEIVDGSSAAAGAGPPRQHAHPYRMAGAENTLAAVPEASSSSERLASESKKLVSTGGEGAGAYEALASVLSPQQNGLAQPPANEQQPNQVGPSGLENGVLVEVRTDRPEIIVHDVSNPRLKGHDRSRSASWAVVADRHPAVALLSGDVAITQLSASQQSRQEPAQGIAAVQRRASMPVAGHAPRSRFFFLGSWLPWSRSSAATQAVQSNAPEVTAEARLKGILRNAVQLSGKKQPHVYVH